MDAFAVLLYTGILVLVNSDNVFLGLAMNSISTYYFLISLFNERIQAKLDSVYEAIYDLPWHSYTIKQRRLFLMVLQCNQIKMELQVGGLHQVSLERFGTVIQTAYSNILVIKEILKLQN